MPLQVAKLAIFIITLVTFEYFRTCIMARIFRTGWSSFWIFMNSIIDVKVVMAFDLNYHFWNVRIMIKSIPNGSDWTWNMNKSIKWTVPSSEYVEVSSLVISCFTSTISGFDVEAIWTGSTNLIFLFSFWELWVCESWSLCLIAFLVTFGNDSSKWFIKSRSVSS